MAITRARLPFPVPWRRGPDEPATAAIASPAPSFAPSAAADLARVEPVVPVARPELEPMSRPAPQPAAVPFEAAVAALHAAESAREATTPRRRGAQRDANGRFVRRAKEPAVPPAAIGPTVRPAPATVFPAPAPAAAPGRPGGQAVMTGPAWSPPSLQQPFQPALDPGAGDDGDALAVSGLRPEPASDEWRSTQPIRLVLVEDVPEVAAHVRDLLRPHSRFKLLHVISDGRRAVDEITSLEPDVVLVDALLQGRTDGRSIVERLRANGSRIGIVVLTVPDHPVDRSLSRHTDAVVTMPFGILDLSRGIDSANTAYAARDPSAGSRIVAVFSAKGGVGKTTIALNLAVSLAESGLRTLLLDGSLQFGDLRRLLRADPMAPSICDVPTDCSSGDDLADVVVRHTTGLDVLLAPPRPELADLVTSRDLDRLFDVLRRAYQAVVIDTPSALSEPTLGMLDGADVIIDVLTGDPLALESTRMITATFAELGYPPAKIRYLVNRFDASGAMPAGDVARAIGRQPDFAVTSDWQLVSSSNAAGIPFVATRPDARASADVRRVADAVRAVTVARGERVPMRRAIWHR